MTFLHILSLSGCKNAKVVGDICLRCQSAEFGWYYYADLLVQRNGSEGNYTLFKPDLNKLMDLSAVDASSVDHLEDSIIGHLSDKPPTGKAIFDGKKMSLVSIKRVHSD
jgi:hypothetical protein